jgi:hypothetical protein
MVSVRIQAVKVKRNATLPVNNHKFVMTGFVKILQTTSEHVVSGGRGNQMTMVNSTTRSEIV